MSRAIKFRAWNKLAKKMAVIDALDFMLDSYRAHAGVSSGSGHLADIDLMQFTGLLDKTGKEIYEGDIVAGLNPWTDWGSPGGGVVTYEDGMWNYGFILAQFAEHPAKEWEVIGNIYETPELLPTTMRNSPDVA